MSFVLFYTTPLSKNETFLYVSCKSAYLYTVFKITRITNKN